MGREERIPVEIGLATYQVPVGYFGSERTEELARELVTIHLPQVMKAYPDAGSSTWLMLATLSLIELVAEKELERVAMSKNGGLPSPLRAKPEELPATLQARKLAGMLAEQRMTRNGRKLVVLSNEGDTEPDPAA